MSDLANPEPHKPATPMPCNATLVGREEINPQLRILRVQPDGPLFEFKPGQFAVLGLPAHAPRVPEADPESTPPDPARLIRRAYSIASASLERVYAEFYVTLVNSGQLTPRLFALNYGDRLFLSPKATGLFTLDRVPNHKAAILIATGTGLAPYMSMLRTLLVHDAERRFIVLHGARYSWDLGYRAELESLARIRPNLTYLPSITRPGQDPHFRGPVGRIQSLLENGLIEQTTRTPLDPAVSEVFLCGNPDMISAAKEFFLARGFTSDHPKTPGTLHAEEYW
jgi:ferredoxin/flavodoxin---NADP+ reductase